MTVPFGQSRPREDEDFASYLERLQNGTLPFRKLDVRGPIHTATKTVTATYSVLETDRTVLGDTTGAAFTITLPPVATVKGRELVFKRVNAGANNLTIDGNAAETIDGAATVVLAVQYAVLRIQSDGLTWWKVA